jgi:CheY-like chemotaxis protein
MCLKALPRARASTSSKPSDYFCRSFRTSGTAWLRTEVTADKNPEAIRVNIPRIEEYDFGLMHMSVQYAPDPRPSGLATLDDLLWGTHLCQFYRDKGDLLDLLVPFFKAGLEANERCLWITSAPLPADGARAALERALPDLPDRMARGQIEIIDYSDWYTRGGGMSPSDVLRGWLTCEQESLAQGYEGLRLSGNTYWLEHKDWSGFAEYEACVHREFHSRRIIALCSYSLEKCSVDDVIDVLRNHRFALVKRGGDWKPIQSATLMLAVNDHRDEGVAVFPTSPSPAKSHDACFFEESEYPSKEIGDYLRQALEAGHAAMLFATRPHIELVWACLREQGVDVAALVSRGQIVVRDADEIADAVIVDGEPSRAAFDDLVAREVGAVIKQFDRVRAYGEIVNVLSRVGNHAAALQLECWWNELLRGNPTAELLCGYSLSSFPDAASIAAFQHVCNEHAAINSSVPAPHADQRRIVAELHQASVALRTEARQRALLEHEHNRLLAAESDSRLQAQHANRHLICLQELTSALSEATTLADVGRVVVSGLQRVFGATVAALTIARGGKLMLVDQVNMTPRQAQKFLLTAADAPFPIADAFRTGQPVWLTSSTEVSWRYPAAVKEIPKIQAVGCIPLMVRGQALGAIALIYTTRFSQDPLQRALLEDYVKQVAMAIERALVFEDAQQARTRLQVLADAGGRIAQAKLDLKRILQTIVDEIVNSGFAHCCAINLRDEETTLMPLAAVRHADPAQASRVRRALEQRPVAVGKGIVGTVAASGKPLRITNGEEFLERSNDTYREYLLKRGITSMVVLPLFASGETVGTLTVSRDSPAVPFTDDDENLLTDLAYRAGLSLENALLYERAQKERERAELANRTKDEFLAMLGHELRNPLSPILTATQLMRLRGGELLNKERTIIERQVNHMVRLVDDLLDVSRITRGKIELKRVPLQLAAVVANAIEMASPLLEERRHRLITSMPSADLPILADGQRLAQVIANLLTNAAKYTPPQGMIEIEASREGERAVLSVADNGIGIDADLLPRIFELFTQGKQTSERAQGGLGLGLAIARQLMEMHGGTLRAESPGKGRGSKFILELPLVTSKQINDTETVVPSTNGEPSGHKILVVDDNEDAANALGELLQMLGHTVRVAHNGPSALKIAEEFQPELGLLDIGLPVMDGYELAQRLRTSSDRQVPKLIAITGYGQAADVRRSVEAGFDDHLVKPVHFERLEAVIDQLLPRPSLHN